MKHYTAYRWVGSKVGDDVCKDYQTFVGAEDYILRGKTGGQIWNNETDQEVYHVDYLGNRSEVTE